MHIKRSSDLLADTPSVIISSYTGLVRRLRLPYRCFHFLSMNRLARLRLIWITSPENSMKAIKQLIH